MTTALIIIAICEVIRMIQNTIQLMAIRQDTDARANAYAEFIKSLKDSDREFVRKLLEAFEKEDSGC